MPKQHVAAEIAALFAELSSVEAVALAGSSTAGTSDRYSDIDLYIYSPEDVPVEARAAIIRSRAAVQAEVDNRFWETGDEWDELGPEGDLLHVDVMFRAPAWIEGELARVLDRHEASIGYTTALWHNVRTSRILFDRRGWLAELKQVAERSYPDLLAQAIIAKNYPLLRGSFVAYPGQIGRAAERHDTVSVNHRIAALLASYFDVLFALNRVPHPGEKRLLAAAARLPYVPTDMVTRVEALLTASAPHTSADAGRCAELLIDGIERLLGKQGELPLHTSQ
jgi:predicted nucleotidyltransferase